MKINLTDLYWAAGFLDGEGHFGHHGKRSAFSATATQKDPWALDRLQNLFGGRVSLYKSSLREERAYDPIWRWAIHGARARGIMMTLYSLLSPTRKQQIRKVLSHPWSIPNKDKTHCKRGHPFSPENTYVIKIKNGGTGRDCKACLKIRSLSYEKKRYQSAHPGSS